jgi:Fe-S cluster assembly scaffold protein SufB
MASKLLKYGIGIFIPETPEGFDRSALTPRTKTIVVPAGAAMRIVEEPEGDRDVEILIEVAEGASVTYVSSSFSKVELVRRSARLAKGAKLEWIDECSAPEFARASFVTRLEGEGAEVEATSLLRGDGKKRFDVFHEIIHAAPRTISNLRVGSVLSGDAKAIVRGLVRVEKGAYGCVSRQKEETLLLSEYAEIDAVPMLEIENQDVRCSHAATVGRLDAEKMFYLMSRGLDHAASEHMLIDAFVEPYLAKLS